LKAGYAAKARMTSRRDFPTLCILTGLLPRSLDVVGLQAQSTDLVMDHDGTNFVFTFGEIKQFLLEVFKLWVGRVEFGKFLINLLLPEPVELLEALKELVDVVFGSLD
jgi:hypothetical protein